MDTAGHYINNDETVDAGNPPRTLVHELDPGDLFSPIALIDISGRVQAKLDKNGGNPSPDTAVTDFSEASANVVTADDIDALAGQVDDGVWLVVNLGWSGFFRDANWETTPYFNGWNFPSLNASAVDRLEIEDEKGIRGIAIDIIGIDTGQGSKGTDD
jgi:hypothetical protein